ncbi:MAG: DUF805 domain-containing protein [Bacteroidota bacterium]
MNWYLKVLKQYADFKGRARRKEYWMFTLFNIIIFVVLFFMAGTLSSVIASEDLILIPVVLYFFFMLIPLLAVTVRRLHDQNKSGWFYCVSFIPFIGRIWLLILMCTEGTAGPNQYGPDPKNPDTELDEIGTLEV